FQRGDIARLNERAGRIGADYALLQYVQYWQLRSRLGDVPVGEIEAFLARNRNSLTADRLRADWLRQLARDKDWSGFVREYPRLSTEDPELACYAFQARLARGESGVLSQARPLWFTSQVLPESCMPVFQARLHRDILSTDDTWTRIRLALETGNLRGAQTLRAYLPANQRPNARTRESI